MQNTELMCLIMGIFYQKIPSVRGFKKEEKLPTNQLHQCGHFLCITAEEELIVFLIHRESEAFYLCEESTCFRRISGGDKSIELTILGIHRILIVTLWGDRGCDCFWIYRSIPRITHHLFMSDTHTIHLTLNILEVSIYIAHPIIIHVDIHRTRHKSMHSIEVSAFIVCHSSDEDDEERKWCPSIEADFFVHMFKSLLDTLRDFFHRRSLVSLFWCRCSIWHREEYKNSKQKRPFMSLLVVLRRMGKNISFSILTSDDFFEDYFFLRFSMIRKSLRTSRNSWYFPVRSWSRS